MREFTVIGVRVDLKHSGHAILMNPNYYQSHMAANYVVVYADPARLAPYMNEIFDRDPIWYGADGPKREKARDGIKKAKTKITEPTKLVDPKDNPLPMPNVNCAMGEKTERKGILRREVVTKVPQITFDNGVTRTLELLAQGAEFIPLETPVSNAPLLQSLVGAKPPSPVADFSVSPEATRAAIVAYYDNRRKGLHLVK